MMGTSETRCSTIFADIGGEFVTDPDTILLWGLPSDPPMAAVAESLRRAGCPNILLDQRAVLGTQVEMKVTGEVAGVLHMADERLDLQRVKAVYLRPYDTRELPSVVGADSGGAAMLHALAVQDMMLSWSELTPALVLNRPNDMAANNSKPHQAQWIESLGFKIPCTLLTTDAEAALQFWRRHGTVIYKSMSGIRSIVSRVTEAHTARFDDIASCPTQFQQYIAGSEYRVHVVGETVFACRIVSAADDYRYSTESVDMQICDLPGDVAERCRSLARAMQLPLAGIDLRRTGDGRWYCLEVNSSPGFTYFEHRTGQPIARAIAQLLMSGGAAGGASKDGTRPSRAPRLRRHTSAGTRGRSTRRGG
jgi:glutathione synthase/RimK-type ligase-like ATP-grasp enzyme